MVVVGGGTRLRKTSDMLIVVTLYQRLFIVFYGVYGAGIHTYPVL